MGNKKKKKKPKKEHSYRYVIRAHFIEGGWIYFIDYDVGFGAIQFAMQYPRRDIAERHMSRVINKFGLRKSLDEYDINDIDFDKIEVYEVGVEYVDPKLFHEGLSKSNMTSYQKTVQNNISAKDKLRQAWDSGEFIPGKGVTYEKALIRVHNRGWDIEKAITQDIAERVRIERDKTRTQEFWELYENGWKIRGKGVTDELAKKRFVDNGWGFEDAMGVPKGKRRARAEDGVV